MIDRTETTDDGWAEARALANKAVESLSRSPFTGVLLLDGGWELHSPAYTADIGKSLDERRQARDALAVIVDTATRGLLT